MERPDFVPALALGALSGWLARSLMVGDAIPPGNVLTAAATVLVGWLIQRTLRRQGELDKIPIENVARIFLRIETQIGLCLAHPPGTLSTDPVLNSELKSLMSEL